MPISVIAFDFHCCPVQVSIAALAWRLGYGTQSWALEESLQVSVIRAGEADHKEVVAHSCAPSFILTALLCLN